MESFKKTGFMVTCFDTSHDIFRALSSGTLVKSYPYNSLFYLTFGKKNIQAADTLMDILNLPKTVKNKKGTQLSEISKQSLNDWVKET